MDIKYKSEVAALGLSRRAQKRVLAALNGWRGARILAAHGGDPAAAATALEKDRAAEAVRTAQIFRSKSHTRKERKP